MIWYEEKASFYYKQWEIAKNSGKKVAAEKAMTEHLNYKQLAEQSASTAIKGT